MHTCRAIGCKPYLAADLRSLPARDFYQEIEYCNAPAGHRALKLRRARCAQRPRRPARRERRPGALQRRPLGRRQRELGLRRQHDPRGVRRRVPPLHRLDAQLLARLRSASSPSAPTATTSTGPRRLFKALYANPERRHLWGLSVHYYTSGSPTKFAAGDALNFNTDDYYDLLTRASIMEKVVTDHWAAIGNQPADSPQVKLVVDEWGAWYGKGTELAPEYNLSQQSTMRDALLTGITLDIFQRHADKVAVANVAQSINCIHSLMLAQGDKFTVTPTFHVFQMYLPHRGAQAVRAEFSAPAIRNPLANAPIPVGGNSYTGSLEAVKLLAGLSRLGLHLATGNAKLLTLTVVNPHLDRPVTTEIAVSGAPSPAPPAPSSPNPTSTPTTTSPHPNAVNPHAATVVAPAAGPPNPYVPACQCDYVAACVCLAVEGVPPSPIYLLKVFKVDVLSPDFGW